MNRHIVLAVLRERNALWQHVDCMDHMFKNLIQNNVTPTKASCRSTNIFKGRERLTEIFLKSGAGHILMIDSDETFCPQTALHLLDLDLPVVSGIVFNRSYPHFPCVYRRDPNSEQSITLADQYKEWLRVNSVVAGPRPEILDMPREGSIFEIDEAGTGCLLVRRDVIEAIEPPRFAGNGPIGTDLMFCRRIREAGFPIYADFRVLLGHITEVAISVIDFANAVRGKNLIVPNPNHAGINDNEETGYGESKPTGSNTNT